MENTRVIPQTEHYTAKRAARGWIVFYGEPDNAHWRASYGTLADSGDVLDHCDMLAASHGRQAYVHFDTRGATT